MTTGTATADEVLRVVTGLRRVLRRRLRARLGLPPLRGAQLELLQQVEAEPGTGVAAAARALHLAPNSVSTLVNQLTADGYLRREPDPADRRAARLFLGRPAVERLARARRIRRDLLGAALAGLDQADRAAIGAALPALTRLAEALDTAAPDSADAAEPVVTGRPELRPRSALDHRGSGRRGGRGPAVHDRPRTEVP